MDRVTVEAFAKINLGLGVVGKRPDGYHEIDTIFQSVSLSDTLVLGPAAAGGPHVALSVTGLDVPKDRVPDVKKTIKKLIHEGRLAYGPSRTVGPVETAKPRGDRLVGVFRRTDEGYGFVRPSGTTPADSRDRDVYIPARKTADASSGDLVMVRLDRRRGGKHPGPRGEIVEIIERESHEFVGTYGESAGAGYVEVGSWWRLGFAVSLLNLAIWLGVGSAWWKVLGLW